MPLLVECSCSSDVSNCKISTLTLELNITESFAGTPGVDAIHVLTILGSPSDPDAPVYILDVSPGDYSIDLPLEDWGPLWNTITVELETGQSLFQVPSPPFSSYDLFRASYYIKQHYACLNVATGIDSGWDVDSYTTVPNRQTVCEPSSGDIRVLCFAGRGVNSVLYKSTPLADCQGCSTADQSFKPGINSTSQINPVHSAQICLCATGGSGNYTYSIVTGNLPSGVTLNADTGCIEGSPDKGKSASPTITFRATDYGGAGAPVGSTVVIGGTGYLDGTSFVWASGAAFFDGMVGTSITINGTSRTIAAVTSPFHLVLT